MVDIPTPEELTRLTGLLLPGIVILWVRSRFRDATPPKLSEKSISYAVVSIAYNAASYSIFHANTGIDIPSPAWQFLLQLAFPLLVGLVMVFFDHSERFYKLARPSWPKARPSYSHRLDYAFRNRQPSYALVHLTDGSQIAGVWDELPFSSSTAGDRDILISEIYHIQDGGQWTKVEPNQYHSYLRW
ncbi:DUF6338 family protein [Sphingomonas sp. MMS24-JH45]